MMENVYQKYQAIIGLEVHAQLSTNSKAYCGDAVEYGALPNTQISAISLGHPGTLPKSNKKVVEFAVKLGLALNCKIRRENEYARKNYFYADLPKGYQITQDKTPICYEGYIDIKDDNGNDKRIRITRIHMEEDAGKSMHDQSPEHTFIDLNRAGVPLLEIVTEPDIRTSTEAYNYLSEIRKIVRYIEVCDGNMEEGSMRCDANVSVMLKDAKEFGNRCEVKNMNSIRNVQRAIDFEIKRQIDEIENGGYISQDTRSFDANNGTTFLLRSKEQANDYRYFPEPDLQPILVEESYINEIKKNLPPLPQQLAKKYIQQLGLSAYDANVITENKAMALYFEELLNHTKNSKAAANWLMGQIKSVLNEEAIEIENFKIKATSIAELINFIDTGKISHNIAAQKIFPEMLKNPELKPQEIAEKNAWVVDNNQDNLIEFINEAIAKYPEKVAEYKSGKKGLLGLFMGEVMKLSKGKADPKITTGLLTEILEKE
ncbi:MAG: Asp-tRNA(Asn)/Glu-tRNA(Gln) amidotransferase subunit GatB [Bacteroidota bacterium]